MKKFTSFIALALALCLLLCSCSATKTDDGKKDETSGDKVTQEQSLVTAPDQLDGINYIPENRYFYIWISERTSQITTSKLNKILQ